MKIFDDESGTRNGNDIRRYYHDDFGFDGTMQESERRLTELFEECGIPMYYD